MRHKPDTNSRYNKWIQSRCAYVNLNPALDTHMSPRNRFGHTSSPCRQELGAECKTSSRSWRDGISHFLSDPPATHFSCFGSKSCISHITPVAAPEEDFLSVIAKFTIADGLLCSLPKCNQAALCCLRLDSLSAAVPPHSASDCQEQVAHWHRLSVNLSSQVTCFPVMADGLTAQMQWYNL